MDFRPIPQTDLKVSTICLGTMTFGRPVGKHDAVRLVAAALAGGINFFDTADMYEGYDRQAGSPGGVAEQILGTALLGRRHEVVITTKVGNAVGDDNYAGAGLSRSHIEHQIEASLRRLQTDYVDLYLLHRPDPATPPVETLQTIDDLIKAGKIRHWGFSNHNVAQISELVTLCRAEGWPMPVMSQPRYNWLDRQAEEKHLGLCQAQGIGIMPYQPLAGGLLTGKYRPGRDIPENSRAVDGSGWLGLPDETMQARLERFVAEAVAARYRPARYALEWLKGQPGVVAPVVGVRSVAQLHELIQ